VKFLDFRNRVFKLFVWLFFLGVGIAVAARVALEAGLPVVSGALGWLAVAAINLGFVVVCLMAVVAAVILAVRLWRAATDRDFRVFFDFSRWRDRKTEADGGSLSLPSPRVPPHSPDHVDQDRH
jgi:hypothetical protein